MAPGSDASNFIFLLGEQIKFTSDYVTGQLGTSWGPVLKHAVLHFTNQTRLDGVGFIRSARRTSEEHGFI